MWRKLKVLQQASGTRIDPCGKTLSNIVSFVVMMLFESKNCRVEKKICNNLIK